MEESNILVVEDNEEDAALLDGLLQEFPYYKVWHCSSGAEALKMIKKNTFAVVLCELFVQGVNGVELTQEILRLAPATSVVMITAYSFIQTAIEAMEKGSYGYVTKPFNSTEIRIVLERATERFYLLKSNQKKEYFAELSVKDGLTGLYNRRFLDAFISKKISSITDLEEKFSILMIDLDYFKKYNDTKGHRAGDELLKDMAALLKKSVRSEDVPFRYGGEEFLVYLDGANKECAQMIAERVLTSVSLYLPTTASMGLGTFPEDGKDVETLIRNTDAALYRAKEGGRNRVCVV